MTSNTAPSPWISDCSNGSYGAAWQAFDKNIVTYWSPSSYGASWLEIKLDGNYIITKYSITSHFEASYQKAPTGWVFQGSADGLSWDTLDTRTAISLVDHTKTGFEFSNVTSYLYYRILTEVHTWYVLIDELTLHE